MALGARWVDVMALVLRQSLITTAIGISVGLAAAAALTRYLDAMLFGVTPLDPVDVRRSRAAVRGGRDNGGVDSRAARGWSRSEYRVAV